ncbi:MAG: alpha amylase C-terminal domain-containing protein, partial [Phaeodactylibacter sp.]|nr:alpha amylase C-terminal domain-containing protein [Phaeodactylibacter sp.]
MGWMHDTLSYFKHDPIHRQYHHNEITFSLVYAFSENFMLPLSHDEVVHGKGSLIQRMPGDEWQRFANLRLLFGYMFTHPGTQLIFMGGEFGQTSEWSIEKGLEWWLTEYEYHSGAQKWVKDLNQYYRTSPALVEKQFSPEGFQWIDHGDYQNSSLSYLRYGNDQEKPIAVICNFTPVVRENYKVGVPLAGVWKEVLNSDGEEYGGSGTVQNKGALKTTQETWHGRPYNVSLNLPPLSIVVLELDKKAQPVKKTKEAATAKPKAAPAKPKPAAKTKAAKAKPAAAKKTGKK